jgi:hypothetical protein
MSVNFSASFTKENKQFNGFTDPEVEPKLIRDDAGDERYVVVGIMRRKFFKNDDEHGTRTPTMTYDRIEVVLDPDEQDLVKAIVKRRTQERTGRTEEEPQPTLLDGLDGERQVPEASAEEELALHREAQAAKAQG